MSSLIEDLRIKYPTSNYPPDEYCPYCHGTGEREVHFAESEFMTEHDVMTPCICIFVEHEFARKIAPIMHKFVNRMLNVIEDEKGNNK